MYKSLKTLIIDPSVMVTVQASTHANLNLIDFSDFCSGVESNTPQHCTLHEGKGSQCMFLSCNTF